MKAVSGETDVAVAFTADARVPVTGIFPAGGAVRCVRRDMVMSRSTKEMVAEEIWEAAVLQAARPLQHMGPGHTTCLMKPLAELCVV